MANLKNITELPVAESAEGLNLIVNDNGSAKQIAASAVGAQADWNETDEASPAFIMNKPEKMSSAVAYRYYGGVWYDAEDNELTDIAKEEIIENFMNGVVRFKKGLAENDFWATMTGYYYYNGYFTVVYNASNGTGTGQLQTSWM